MVNLPSAGAPNWDVPLNTALGDLAHGLFNPTDLGFVAWNYDPVQVSSLSAATPTSGSVRMHRMPRLTRSTTITNVNLILGTPSATLVPGQNQVGIYSVAGVLLASSMDATSYFSTGGLVSIPLAVPYNAAPNVYYVAALQNATSNVSPLGVCAATDVGGSNGLTTPANGRFTNGPTGQTSLPASVTMSSRVLSLQATWSGVS